MVVVGARVIGIERRLGRLPATRNGRSVRALEWR